MPTKDLEYYRGLPYTRRCEPAADRDDKGRLYWLAWIQELEGCRTDGTSDVDAMRNLDDAFDQYVTAMLKWGSSIPEPRSAGREAATPPILKVRVGDDELVTGGSVSAEYPAITQESSRSLIAAGSP